MNKIFKLVFTIVVCLLGHAKAQLNPLGAQYFLNEYFANPAMAGIAPGYEATGALKWQWSNFAGAPLMQTVTLTHGSQNKKVGLGLHFYNERAGVLNRTNVKATYAYHLPVNETNSFLDFGLSLGYMDEWINFAKVRGDDSDMSLANFNQRHLYLDADFGFALRLNDLKIQGAAPNLKRLMSRDVIRSVADRSLYMASLSYALDLSGNSIRLEPRIVYRGIQNYEDIVDVGANLSFAQGKLLLNGIYHTSNSVTLGAGTTYNNQLSILCQYTTNTADLQGYSNGEVELGLKYHF